MNDLQDVIKTIQEMAPMIDPTDDYMTIAAAEDQMRLTGAAREKELDEAHANLRTLARLLDAARASSTRPLSLPSEEEHAKTLNDLDATRLSLAKAINDAEGALASKEVELARLKEETQELERSDPAGEHDLDGTAIRLQVFKGLGFEPVADKAGNVNKILIRSTSGEVHCVSLNTNESHAEQTDTLWKLVSS